MKSKLFLFIFLTLLSAGNLMAGWNIQTGKVYYITCNHLEGFVSLGKEQGNSYALYYQTAAIDKTADAYWLLTPSGKGYTIRNNKSGEYLTWIDIYEPDRNLGLTSTVQDDKQRWTLESTNGGIVIRSLYNSNYHLNTRNGTNLVALYNGGIGTNSVFRIWDTNGGEVTYTDQPADDVTVSGYNSSVTWDGEGDTHLFPNWTSSNAGKDNTTSAYTVRFTLSKDITTEIAFDWSVINNAIEYAGTIYSFSNFTATLDSKNLIDKQEISAQGSYQKEHALKAGTHTLRFTYTKSTDQWGSSAGEDQASVQGLCVSKRQKVESITLEGNTQMEVGDKQQLRATVLPEDALNPTLSWTSSNTQIVNVDSNGQVEATGTGKAIITAAATDGSGISAQFTISIPNPYMDYGSEMLYLRHLDSTVTVIPRDLVQTYTHLDGLFSATLANQQPYEIKGIIDISEQMPADVPAFSSYKFNNKYNPQVFTDVLSATPSADTLQLSVAGIGRWLTASFQTADPQTRAYVDGVRQRSKITRQSFANPITYELSNPKWNILKLRLQPDSTYTPITLPYTRKQMVFVDFLTDHSTNEYTVPRIDITLVNDQGLSTGSWDYSNWIGMNGKAFYHQATIAIQGGGVFPDMPHTPVQIKGRGNSTWSHSDTSKNPYRIKFATKQKPLGMTAGKSWILLANKQSGSMTTNAMGMKIAGMFGTAAANHIVPVELYVNGSYRGSYNLTEKVGFSNNNVDILDESYAAMIEMDTYGEEDGRGPDYNNAYSLAAKVNEPDFDEEYTAAGGTLTYDVVMNDFANMTSVLNNGSDDYTKLVDADYLARFLATNELILNRELSHPKSVFLYSEDVTNDAAAPENETDIDPTPWVFGPVWDCDWAFGYEGNHTYYVNNAEADYFTDMLSSGTAGTRAKAFWNDLRFNSTQVDSTYYHLWTNFMQRGGVQELLDYADDYYLFAKQSILHNRTSESSEKDTQNYLTITRNCQKWLEKRAQSIYARLTPYTLPQEPADTDEEPAGRTGDVNSDGAVSAADMVALLNHLAGLENETFMIGRADANSSGTVNADDEAALLSLIWQQQANANRNLHLPRATMSLRARSAAAMPQSHATIPLQMEINEGRYSALQADIQLPMGVELNGVKLPNELSDMKARTRLMENGLYRMVIYANGATVLPEQLTTINLEVITAESMEEKVMFSGLTASTALGEEERLPNMACRLVVNDTATDGIRDTHATTQGKTDTTMYDLSGRRIKSNTNHKGVFIQQGRKIVK